MWIQPGILVGHKFWALDICKNLKVSQNKYDWWNSNYKDFGTITYTFLRVYERT